MYEFVDRLFNIALPRVRDFRGINPNAFDGRGNYSMHFDHYGECPKFIQEEIIKKSGSSK